MKRLMWLVPVALLCSVLAIQTMASAAHAVVTDSLEAVSMAPWEWSDFSIAWTDKNHDRLFQLNELEPGGFSGVTYLPVAWFYERIVAVPALSTQSPFTGSTSKEWLFRGPMGSFGADPSLWSYTSSVSAAPIPASALLLGSPLAGLGLLGWRRKKG